MCNTLTQLALNEIIVWKGVINQQSVRCLLTINTNWGFSKAFSVSKDTALEQKWKQIGKKFNICGVYPNS